MYKCLALQMIMCNKKSFTQLSRIIMCKKISFVHGHPRGDTAQGGGPPPAGGYLPRDWGGVTQGDFYTFYIHLYTFSHFCIHACKFYIPVYTCLHVFIQKMRKIKETGRYLPQDRGGVTQGDVQKTFLHIIMCKKCTSALFYT